MFSFCLVILLSLFCSSSANNCNLDVRLQQELLNKGFHRNLTYSITFLGPSGFSQYEGCFIGLDQVLPAGVFASPDELGDLMRINKLTAIPKNRVNTELPAEESQPSSVFIIREVDNGEANLWLPIHARYHRAADKGGLHSNDIGAPGVFLRCPHSVLDNCDTGQQITFPCTGRGKDNCLWKKIPVSVVFKSSLSLEVPVGNLQHYRIVALATGAAAVACSLYLLKTLHTYKLAARIKLKL